MQMGVPIGFPHRWLTLTVFLIPLTPGIVQELPKHICSRLVHHPRCDDGHAPRN